MRVIAGEARGRRLYCPRGLAIRPAPDRLREALFAVLGERVEAAAVTDLFAGTGSLGIEALSRGASRALFVDRSDTAVRAIRKNLDHSGLAHLALVRRADVFRAAGRLPEDQRLIFVDPPYDLIERQPGRSRVLDLIDRLLSGAALASGGLLVFRHPSRLELGLPGHVADRRRYGSSSVVLIEDRAER